MLSYKNRFHGYNSLRFVYRQGESVRSSLMIVKYTENPRRTHSRFSVVISKKVLKSAVRRNRVRRRLYEIIRQELPTIKSNRDIVVMVFSAEVLQLDHQVITNHLKQLFSQADLYK